MHMRNSHSHMSLLLTQAEGHQTRSREEITYFPHLYQNVLIFRPFPTYALIQIISVVCGTISDSSADF